MCRGNRLCGPTSIELYHGTATTGDYEFQFIYDPDPAMESLQWEVAHTKSPEWRKAASPRATLIVGRKGVVALRDMLTRLIEQEGLDE